jgi:hypothetical protein
MAITQKSMKLLWANAAGRCSFIDCQCRLCPADAGGAAPFIIGEMAHIRGERAGSNRHDASLSPDERDDYANLILLCPNHHATIDKSENEKLYGVDVLHKMKYDHERFVAARLQRSQFVDKHEVAAFIYPLLEENHEVFTNYGPTSEIARRNPESDAHGVWLSERLATIIPNNRRIAEIVAANSGLFNADEQVILSRFGLHARTYDQWVGDDISYEGVVRFPAEFEALISEAAHVGK